MATLSCSNAHAFESNVLIKFQIALRTPSQVWSERKSSARNLKSSEVLDRTPIINEAGFAGVDPQQFWLMLVFRTVGLNVDGSLTDR